ncbi:MAG: PEP-CTERM sorting domain-containing protein [Rhodospirillaceae bacterium]|nr:PEP-CTERM sorting domain-containing protein [Rhodospirillaceae bacterium]
MKLKAPLAAAALATAAALAISPASAGPVIIDGTDANDHGSYSGVANVTGWEYMQRALENLGTTVSGSAAKVVRVMGLSSPGSCGGATSANGSSYQCAFQHSSLPGMGWTIAYDSTMSALTGMTLSTANTGILLLPTVGLASGGDMSSAELAIVNANAALIQSFNGGLTGGALFAMGEIGTGAFDWLSTLIPGITFTTHGGGGISTNVLLTGAGAGAFPGLTDADLAGADPWHVDFRGNLGSLIPLGQAPQGGLTRDVIIGGGVGTVITPDPPPTGVVAEPGTLALFGLGLAGIGFARRRKVA